jgi:protoporphyrinogen oxidase
MKADIFEKQTDNEVQTAIVKDFCRIAGVSSSPVWMKVSRYPKILPSYDMRYLNWKKDVETLSDAVKALYLVGQSYQPGGLSGCVLGAQKTAEEILNRWADFEFEFDASREMEVAYASD